MRRKIIRSLVALVAISLITLALFAFQLGIDNNPAWGSRRIGILLAGGSLFFWAAWDQIKDPVLKFLLRILKNLQAIPLVHSFLIQFQRVSKAQKFLQRKLQAFTKAQPAWLSTAIPIGAIGSISLVIYIWVITAGTMSDWPQGSRYFYMLGQAFSNGQLFLLEQPSPELLAADNPYYYEDRGDIPVIWDALFFEGKYYLYWGPIPGLIVAALQPFFNAKIRDPALLFSFMVGTIIFGGIFLGAIRRRYKWVSTGTLIAGLVALLLNAGWLWLLTRPKVYEAAIAGGQFFLISGLFWAFTALERPEISRGRLALAGVSWAIAANTRVNLALAITFLGILVFWRIIQRSQGNWRNAFLISLPIGIPLAIGALSMMGYNQARFGSPTNFGYSYLITGPTIPADPTRVSSPEYIVPNFYTYLVRPPEVRTKFPYLIVPWIKNEMWPFFIDLPPDYFYTEPVASMLLTVPVMGLGALAFLRMIWLQLNGFGLAQTGIPIADRRSLRWLLLALGGSAILNLGVLLFFINSSFRYAVDFTLVGTLLAVLFLAQFRARIEDRNAERVFWRMGWKIAAFLTPVFGILIAITGYARAFLNDNPALYQQLKNWFP